jgi:biopolymer transport protein ExbD
VKFEKRVTEALSFNFTPLIDLTFSLLIFFILTAEFAALEMEKVSLPYSSEGKTRDYTQYRNVVINVVNPESPAILVMGHTMTDPDLIELLKDLNAKCKRDGAKMNVILRADGEAHYEDVARVMFAAGNAEIESWWMQVDISASAKREEADAEKAISASANR